MKTSELLRKAKRVLWHGKNYRGKQRHTDTYICYAIDSAAWGESEDVREKAQAVQDVILDRLSPCCSLEGWLAEKGCLTTPDTYEKTTVKQIQKHRHAWLDMLIKEYEDKGD